MCVLRTGSYVSILSDNSHKYLHAHKTGRPRQNYLVVLQKKCELFSKSFKTLVLCGTDTLNSFV